LASVAFVVWNAGHTLHRLDAVAVIERDQLSMEVQRPPTVQGSTLSPLSAVTFYLRHRRRGAALVVTLGLMVLGVSFPAFVFGPMMDAWSRIFEHLSQVTVVSPRIGSALDPAVTAQIREYTDVDAVVPAMKLRVRVDVPPMAHPSIPLYAVATDDLEMLIGFYGAQIEQGHLPEPRSNQVALSEALAQNRNWHVGDKIGRAYGDRTDDELPTEMIVVGILSSPPGQPDLWTGFASLAYMSNHEFYAGRSTHLLVLPMHGRKRAMDRWLREQIASSRTSVQTYDQMQADLRIGMWLLLAVFAIIESVIAVVAAVAAGLLSYTFFAQRRQEYGVLYAIGHNRSKLVWLTVRESAGTVAVAWLLGMMLCAIGLVYMRTAVFAPKGVTFNLFHPAPWLFTLPLPLAVVVVGSGLVTRMLRRLDPVAIIDGRAT
jgi:ABC-type lipoprotein release transport system permease subunit